MTLFSTWAESVIKKIRGKILNEINKNNKVNKGNSDLDNLNEGKINQNYKRVSMNELKMNKNNLESIKSKEYLSKLKRKFFVNNKFSIK